MQLTIKEAATLLGRSERTVRHQIATGHLPGVKQDGQWRIERAALPLTDAQRDRLRARGDVLRATLEAALPEVAREATGRSVRQLLPFEATRVLLHGLPADLAQVVGPLLVEALCALAEGHYEFEAGAKIAAWRRARVGLSRAVGVLHGLAPETPAAATTIEEAILPRIAGLLRSAESLERRARS